MIWRRMSSMRSAVSSRSHLMSLFPSLQSRHRQSEWMDAPDADPDQLRRSLRFIRLVNWLLGYKRVMVRHLERFSRGWQQEQTIRILDLGTGSADIPRAILRWARARRWDIRIIGLDLHAATLADAAAAPSEPRLRLVRGDALNAPFADESFDYVLTAMFLHHLDDGQAQRVLTEMNRLARRGVIASDLLRHRRAYFWISLFTVLANPMVRHDARVSVAQAFSGDEVLRMRKMSGLGFTAYHRHFGHRFSLAGEKQL